MQLIDKSMTNIKCNKFLLQFLTGPKDVWWFYWLNILVEVFYTWWLSSLTLNMKCNGRRCLIIRHMHLSPWIVHLREGRVQGSSIWFYLYETSAQSTPIGSKMVKLNWRWTVSWRCLLSPTLVNDKLPLEMCHKFKVLLLLMCAHNFEFLSK